MPAVHWSRSKNDRKPITHETSSVQQQGGTPVPTAVVKKHNHSTDDTSVQYGRKYSRHCGHHALTEFASDSRTGATCLKLSQKTIEAPAPVLPSPVCSSLN